MEATTTPKDIIDSIKKEEANILKISYKQKPKPTIDNWNSLLPSFIISHTTQYKEPPVCIEFVNKSGDVSQFGSLGNFSAIIGKAKSRKTFLLCLYLAAAIKKNPLNEFIRVTLPDEKNRVILVDTEQSPYDVSKVDKRVLTIAEEVDPKNFEVYSFRSLSPPERLFMTEQLIYSKDDLGILVLDGIRDFISDINSPEEATMISSKLLKWTQERHIHIIVVLHQNKGDNNARGHVGSELINKSESVISV